MTSAHKTIFSQLKVNLIDYKPYEFLAWVAGEIWFLNGKMNYHSMKSSRHPDTYDCVNNVLMVPENQSNSATGN